MNYPKRDTTIYIQVKDVNLGLYLETFIVYVLQILYYSLGALLYWYIYMEKI